MMLWLVNLILGIGIALGGNCIGDAIAQANIQHVVPGSTWIQPTIYRRPYLKWKKALELFIRKKRLAENIAKMQKITAFVEVGKPEDSLKELNITLNLPKEKDQLIPVVEDAVIKLYKEYCDIKSDDICTLIKELDGNIVGTYSPFDNIIEIKQSHITASKLTEDIAHELMHKYSHQNLGYLPNWLDEGFSTQFGSLGDYEEPVLSEYALPNFDLEKNFSYIDNYPENENDESLFYSFNQRFIRLWLKKNNITLGKLIKNLQPLVKGKSQEDANIILRNYLMENGGREILEERGFKIPESWNLGQSAKKTVTIKQVEFREKKKQNLEDTQKKNSQEKKPKKAKK